MPRKRKTISGADAQNIGSVPGQRYGEGIEQQGMQQAMPAPDLAQGDPGMKPGPTPGPEVAPPARPDPALMQQFLSSHNPNLLARTQQPNVPLTDGLSTGPGRGPNALSINRTPLAKFLNTLGDSTGQMKWKRLAQRAGL